MSRQTKILTSIAAGSCAVFLMGCRDRDRDIVQTDTTPTAEQREDLAYNTPATPAPGTTSTAATDSTRGFDTSSAHAPSAPDQAQIADSDRTQITLHEEQLNVEKREVDAGGVLISKDVVSEQVEQPVELERERVQVTQLSPEEARERGESDEARIDEDQIYIPLKREEAVAQKEVTTSGGVQIDRESETEQTTVADSVRREVVDIERHGDAEESDQVSSTTGYASAESQQRETPTMQAGETQDLEQRIRESLRSEDSLALTDAQIEDIDIEVDQDTVRLSGSVPNQETAQQIEDSVRRIDGVQMVQNELEAEPAIQAAE